MQQVIDATSAVRIASPWRSPHRPDCSDVEPPVQLDFQRMQKDPVGDVARAWERALVRVPERSCDGYEPQPLKLAL